MLNVGIGELDTLPERKPPVYVPVEGAVGTESTEELLDGVGTPLSVPDRGKSVIEYAVSDVVGMVVFNEIGAVPVGPGVTAKLPVGRGVPLGTKLSVPVLGLPEKEGENVEFPEGTIGPLADAVSRLVGIEVLNDGEGVTLGKPEVIVT